MESERGRGGVWRHVLLLPGLVLLSTAPPVLELLGTVVSTVIRLLMVVTYYEVGWAKCVFLDQALLVPKQRLSPK